MCLHLRCHDAQKVSFFCKPLGPQQFLIALLTLLPLTLMNVSCSSVSAQSTESARVNVPFVTVQIAPQEANIVAGGSQQFNATVRGTGDTAVTWSASQGTISSGGFFVAPKQAPASPIMVTATSVASPHSLAAASVTFALAQLAIVSTSLPAAQAGTSYNATLQSSGGVEPYAWSLISGSLPSGLSLHSNGSITGTTQEPGAFAFSVKVTDSASQIASVKLSLSVGAASNPGSGSNYSGYDGPAQLPLAYMQTAMADTPAPGSVITVKAGGDLQGALNTVDCGDTIELQAGAVFSGFFTVRAKSCDDQHWIIIRTSTPDAQLPPEGTRMTPCYAGVTSLPARPAYPCSNPQKLLAAIEMNESGVTSGPIQFASGANHYRFVGLEITHPTGVTGTVNLMGMQNGVSDSGDHIIIDRSWIHGTAQDDTRRGIALGGMSYVGIIDSYFSDFHCTSITGTCTDANDVGGGSGDVTQSVWKIDDNFLEAAGECVLLGGDAATVVPSDIEIRFNHFFKPLTWLNGAAGFVGGKDGNPFVVKNHFEMKSGMRVLLEGNIFDNNWGGFTQHGHSIVLTPRDHYNTVTHIFDCAVCKVTDITIRYNTISHVGAGFNLSNGLSHGEQAAGGERYSIHDDLIDDVEASGFNGGGGLFLIQSYFPTHVLNSLQITHVTGFPDPTGKILAIAEPANEPKMPGFVFTDNIVSAPGLPVFGAGGGAENCDRSSSPAEGLNGCFADYVFTGNVLIASPDDLRGEWPSGNSFPNSPSDVQFVNYNGGNGGNYTLMPSSPYRSSSGTNPGADIAAVNAEIAGVY
jgi:hypothetical protein